MKLDEVRLLNFRAYRDECRVPIAKLTALVGRNDVGKSTVLDALGIFFGHEQCKIEPGDRCVHTPDADVAITCIFSELPTELILDEAAKTSLADEFLLNAESKLEIKKVYSGERMKEETFVVAQHPSKAPYHDLLLLKNLELKKRAKELDVTADQRSNVDLRRAIRASAGGDLAPTRKELPVTKEGAKDIWSALQRELPLFALFRADRPSTDEDSEVQDPMRLAIKQALKEAQKELAAVQELVSNHALEVAKQTLLKLSEFDNRLASTLTPRFRTEPKWDGLFKLSLNGDNEIPINKRGSGVRRLVLLSFFQAEVERRRKAENVSSVIYAIEEPETSQHPTNQVAVIEGLKELSESPGCQVVLTTHVPALAGLIPAQSIQLVTQNDQQLRQISSGDGILNAVAEELGVLPDPFDFRVKAILCVEGPTDIEFLTNITPLVRQVDPTLVELGVDPRVAMVPLGGGTLKAWVNKRYLRDLNIPEVHIYDSDVAEYADACADVNARPDKSWATQTRKREIENYLHSDAINEAIGVAITVTDTNDVEADIRAALGGRKRINGRSIKHCLAVDATKKMTVERLRARGGLEEIVEWFKKINSYL